MSGTAWVPSQTTPPLLDPSWERVAHWSQLGLDPAQDDDDEWEPEELSYVTLDFGRHLQPDIFRQHAEFQLLELESPTPYARLGTAIFRGQHERLIGSEILFQCDKQDGTYHPFTTTSHRITFQPVSLLPPTDEKAASPIDLLAPSLPKEKKKPGRKPKPKAPGEEDAPKRKPGRPRGSKSVNRGASTRGSGRGAKASGATQREADDDLVVPGGQQANAEAGPSGEKRGGGAPADEMDVS